MPLTRRALILGMAGLGIVQPLWATAGLQIEGGLAFGSSWRVLSDDRLDLARLRPTLDAALGEIDAQMSPYRAASPLSKFNAIRTQAWQDVPPALCHVTSKALGIARLTEGAFDPTVGPLVSRFGFGPIKGGAGSYMGISVGDFSLRKSAPDLTLDLCGIAKGFALDRVVQTLVRAGVVNALVEIGGEVKTVGHHPSGRDWQVAIADPTVAEFKAFRIINPRDKFLATSGHAANGLRGPINTSHIIDPHLAQTASTTLASVSVLADTGMQADALATALCAAGPEAGVALARRLNIAALFIFDRPNRPIDAMTGGFAKHVLI